MAETIKTARYQEVEESGNGTVLFEECMKQLEAQFSQLHAMKISQQPLICITPLRIDVDDKIKLIDNMKTEKF